MYIYLFRSIYICIFAYFYMGQSFKEVNLAGINNCLTLVVKVKSLRSITSRQCHSSYTLTKSIQVILIVL